MTGIAVDLETILRATLKPALGCTEPVAVAYAVATAIQAASGWRPGQSRPILKALKGTDIEIIRVSVNRNVFKNAFSIAIPNTGGRKGILTAAALGPWCNPEAGLELFAGIDERAVDQARDLIERGVVKVEIVDASHTDLYMEAYVRFRHEGQTREGSSIFEDEHTNLILLKSGMEEVFRSSMRGRKRGGVPLDQLARLTFEQMVRMTEDLSAGSQAILRQAIEVNLRASESGLVRPMGLGIGFYGQQDARGADRDADFSSAAAAGSDARMSGHPVPVMSSAGSGNQGIVATMPVVIYCRDNGIDEGVLLRAVGLSHLITLYATAHMGYLTNLCGVALKAGIGAACGITYARGGRAPEVQRAVKIMAAALSGIICDGAKPSCALKVNASADMAARAASLALRKVEIPDDNGIVAETAEETIRNLGQLNLSMKAADETIVELLREKMARLEMPRPPSPSQPDAAGSGSETAGGASV